MPLPQREMYSFAATLSALTKQMPPIEMQANEGRAQPRPAPASLSLRFPVDAGDIRRQRVSRMRDFRHWRMHLDEMHVKLHGEMACALVGLR